MSLLNRIQVIPYELEFRDTVDAALHRLDQLEAAAAEWIVLSDKLLKDAKIDHLEAFLAAFARVSLLIFPVSKTPFAKKRAATLQSCLALDETSLLANRDLRDSWIHHDERLDEPVESGVGASGQVFMPSHEVSESVKRTFLRVIEIDTLDIHYRDRQGLTPTAHLKQVRAALEELDECRKTAFEQLPMPREDT